jgi:hypothetical protein
MKQVIYLHAPGKTKTNHDVGAMGHWPSDDGAGDDHLDAGPGNDVLRGGGRQCTDRIIRLEL